jgi:hypothetical protein
MRSLVRWAVLATVGVATAASAQGSPPRLSVAPVRGDKNNAVGSQINGELCKAYDCVPFAKVSTNKKPDWKKAKKEKVVGIVATTISKTKRGYSAGVALMLGGPKPAHAWNFPLSSHRNLSGPQLKQLVGETAPLMGLMEDVSGVAAIAAAEAPRAAPPPAVATTTPQSRMDTVPPPEVLPVIPPPPGAASERSLADTPVAADATPPPSPPGIRGQPLVSVEVGGNFLNRNLSYTPADQQGLRTYNASVIGLLMVGLEVFPLAKSSSFLSGLGLFGQYQFSIGLKSNAGLTSVGEVNTSFSMLAAGIEARIRPIKYSDFAIVVPVAFRTYKFTVDNATSFVGLPNQNLMGVSAGLKFEIPIGTWFAILVGGDYVFWFQKKELIGNTNPTYFPSGSAGAFEGEFGFAFYIVGPLSVRVVGEYSSTKYSFNPDPSGTYNATGASDTLIGGRATIRLDF